MVNLRQFAIRLSRIPVSTFFLTLLMLNIVAIAAAAPVGTSLSLSSSPNPALTTDKVTIGGTLTGSGKGVANQKVQVQYSTDGKKWVSIATATTGSDGRLSASWKAPGQGKYYIRATFSGNKQYSSSTSNVVTQTVVQATTVTPPPTTKLSMLSGVAVGNPLGEAAAQLAKAGGITWIRADVNFVSFQTTYAAAQKYGISVIGILDYSTVAWNSAFTLDDWKQAVQKAQKMYPSIHKWEIWNEPTVTAYQLGYMDGSARHYVDLLQAAYKILKAGDSKSVVLGLGGGQIGYGADPVFARTVFSLGGGAFMDAISIHAYAPQLNIGKSWDDYKQLWTKELEQYKKLGKPFWVTETGLESNQPTEAGQATFLASCYTFFKEQGGAAFIWYQLGDYSADGSLHMWGLLRIDLTTKPSYTQYSTILKTST